MDRSMTVAICVVVLAVVAVPSTASAYVGPGGLVTAIGAFLAVLVALVAALVGFVWLPLKRFLIWIRG